MSEVPAHSSVIVCVGDRYRAKCLDCDWTSYVYSRKAAAEERADDHQDRIANACEETR